MSIKYCNEEHKGKANLFITATKTVTCEECRQTFEKQGFECSSINVLSESYLCDIKGLKNKYTVISDEIVSKAAKIKLSYEKLADSISGAIESYIAEVIKLKQQLLEELNSEKDKIVKTYESETKNIKEGIDKEVEILGNHFNELNTLIQSNNKEQFLPLLGSFNITKKSNDFEELNNEISPILMKEPSLLYNVIKRNPTKETIMNQIEIIRRHEQYSDNISPKIVKPPQISSNIFQNIPIVHCFFLDKLYIYDISRDKKYIIDAPPTEIFPTKNFPTAIIRDSIFVCGGSSPDILTLRTTFTFEMKSLEFVQRKSMVNGRFKHALAVVGSSKIFVIGGVRGKNAIRECIKYDIDSDIWTQVPYLNVECYSMAAFTYKSRYIYIIGGINNTLGGFSSEIEKFDTMEEQKGWQRIDFRSNSWSARYAMNSCQLSDQYFLIFGGANVTYQNHCFLYDAENESLLFISRLLAGAKFELQQPMPIIFNDSLYSIDEERNLHVLNIKSNIWSLFKWHQWKPNSTKVNFSKPMPLKGYY